MHCRAWQRLARLWRWLSRQEVYLRIAYLLCPLHHRDSAFLNGERQLAVLERERFLAE